MHFKYAEDREADLQPARQTQTSVPACPAGELQGGYKNEHFIVCWKTLNYVLCNQR